jgi:hypothetical protein
MTFCNKLEVLIKNEWELSNSLISDFWLFVKPKQTFDQSRKYSVNHYSVLTKTNNSEHLFGDFRPFVLFGEIFTDPTRR